MPNLIEFLFFAVPAAAVTFFAVSLYRYLSDKKQNKRRPGSVSELTMKDRKLLLILSAVIAGVLVAAMIFLIVMLYLAIRNM